jgi:hypothetical protein
MDDRFVDTNIISYLLKRDTRGDLYRPHPDGKSLYLSYITVAELYRWAIAYSWGTARISDLQARLQIYTVADFDDQTAWEWAGHVNQGPPDVARRCMDRRDGSATRLSAGHAQSQAVRARPRTDGNLRSLSQW